MILFPKDTPPSARWILKMYLENDKNKKIAAHESGVTLRRVQQVTSDYKDWLQGYKTKQTS